MYKYTPPQNTPSGFDHPRHDEEHDLINHNARVAEMIDAELGPDERQFIIGLTNSSSRIAGLNPASCTFTNP